MSEINVTELRHNADDIYVERLDAAVAALEGETT